MKARSIYHGGRRPAQPWAKRWAGVREGTLGMNAAITKPHAADYTARARLFGGNRMKLGVMAFNCSHGSTITTVPEAWKLNWADTVEIAQAVDRSGMETLLPVGRWRGYGGPSDFNNTHVRELHLGVGARRADELRHGARHLPRAAGASADGGQDGVHHRPRHQRTLRAQRGVRLVQERVRHVRRAHAPARRPLQVRDRMAGLPQAGLDARRRVRLQQRELPRSRRSGASRSRCRSRIRR